MPVPDGWAVKTRWGDICAKRPNWLAALVLPRDGVARGGKGGEGWRPGYVYVIWVDTRLSVTHTVDEDERRERISRRVRVYTCCLLLSSHYVVNIAPTVAYGFTQGKA